MNKGMITLKNGFLLGLIFCCTSLWAAPAQPFSQRPDVQAYIQQVAKQYQLDPQQLTTWFNQVTPNPKVIELMDKPYEAKPWYIYRTWYVTPQRITQGVAFWNKHKATLTKAEATYGVPASVITAIIGVETNYGNMVGNYPLFNTLSTFAFDYPRRSTFFQKELTELLLLCKEKNLDPFSLKGSYAGAVGLPQFMPSNLRRYAVDFDKDGHINIWETAEDAIGSVANYLKEHGWQAGQPIAERAKVKGNKYKQIKQQKNFPSFDKQQLSAYGIYPQKALTAQQKVNLIELEGKTQPEFWVGFYNFYMIRRYNPSNNYAMAVYQLSKELQKMHTLPLVTKPVKKS